MHKLSIDMTPKNSVNENIGPSYQIYKPREYCTFSQELGPNSSPVKGGKYKVKFLILINMPVQSLKKKKKGQTLMNNLKLEMKDKEHCSKKRLST